MNEVVTVEITVTDPAQNPQVALVAPRWDVPDLMDNYDRWLEVVGGDLTIGTEWHITATQTVTALDNGSKPDTVLDQDLIGMTLPYILVVPTANWVPPYEASSISGPNPVTLLDGPYAYFYDYYSSMGADYPNWYEIITDSYVGLGGLSW
jgi:hypothetical protein